MTHMLLNRFARLRVVLVAVTACMASAWALDPNGAQLSSPVGDSTIPIPMGTGPGVHGANSPFAPLKERSDVLPWSVLTAAKSKVVKNRMVPVFSSDIQALHNKSLRIQGFMMPLDPGEKQKHFLLSSVPLSCPFCVPGGPESMVEVKTKTPVKYSMEAVVVEGQFAVLNDDPNGLYYRITDAVPIK